MISKKTALKEAGRFAAALDGPLGRRPMQRVICEFLPFLRDLRATGAGWGQITSLLMLAGARSRSGQPLKEASIRTMVSRAELAAMKGAKPVRKTANSEGRASREVPDASISIMESGANFPHRSAAGSGNAALCNVSERIKRASVLRTPGYARHG